QIVLCAGDGIAAGVEHDADLPEITLLLDGGRRDADAYLLRRGRLLDRQQQEDHGAQNMRLQEASHPVPLSAPLVAVQAARGGVAACNQVERARTAMHCRRLLLSLVAALGLAFAAAARAAPAQAPPPDWTPVATQAATLLADYIRIDTQTPPGHTTDAVTLLEAQFRAAGIPSERIQHQPDKPMLLAR